MLKTDSSGSKGMHIISVSHCWEAEQHPDPFGSQSRRLAEQLQRESKWLGLDMWCFWVAVKELKLSYYIGETLLFTIYIYTHYGNSI